MATNVNISTTFPGEAVNKIFGALFLEDNSVRDGLVTVLDGKTADNVILPQTKISDAIVDYACGDLSAGNISLTEKKVLLKKLMVPLEICKQTFRQRWFYADQGSSAWNSDMATTEMNRILEDLTKMIKQHVEDNLWNGTNTSGKFQGILTELLADADANKVSGAVLDVTNVADAFEAVLLATPNAVLKHPSFKLVTDIKTKMMLGAANRKANFSMSGDDFNGVKIEVANGLPEGTIITYVAEEVFFITALESDFNEIIVEDNAYKQQYLCKAIFSAGASYVDAKNITIYVGS